jgi:hypothetical protein
MMIKMMILLIQNMINNYINKEINILTNKNFSYSINNNQYLNSTNFYKKLNYI